MTSQSEHRYRRLPGRAFSPISRDSLWLAEDHLLSVQSNRFSETYRRYYFRDIQAFAIQRTAPISPWTYGAGAVAAAFLTPGLLFDFQRTFLWISGSLFLAITLALIGLGPTCSCYIQTAVSRDTLGSLRWVRTAERALGILHPCVEQVQGPVTEELAALPSGPPPIPSQIVQPPPLPGRKEPETGWGYEFLFVVFLADSLHSYLGLTHKGTAMDIAAWVILIIEIVCILWLMIRQRRFEVSVAIRVIVILALIVTAGFTYAVNILSTVSKQLRIGTAGYLGYVPLHITAVGCVWRPRCRRPDAHHSPSAILTPPPARSLFAVRTAPSLHSPTSVACIMRTGKRFAAVRIAVITIAASASSSMKTASSVRLACAAWPHLPRAAAPSIALVASSAYLPRCCLPGSASTTPAVFSS